MEKLNELCDMLESVEMLLSVTPDDAHWKKTKEDLLLLIDLHAQSVVDENNNKQSSPSVEVNLEEVEKQENITDNKNQTTNTTLQLEVINIKRVEFQKLATEVSNFGTQNVAVGDSNNNAAHLMYDPFEDDEDEITHGDEGDSEFGEWEKYTKGVGGFLMRRMGFRTGKGLGKNLQGEKEIVSLKLKYLPPNSTHGLGFIHSIGNNDDLNDPFASNEKMNRDFDDESIYAIFQNMGKKRKRGNRPPPHSSSSKSSSSSVFDFINRVNNINIGNNSNNDNDDDDENGKSQDGAQYNYQQDSSGGIPPPTSSSSSSSNCAPRSKAEILEQKHLKLKNKIIVCSEKIQKLQQTKSKLSQSLLRNSKDVKLARKLQLELNQLNSSINHYQQQIDDCNQKLKYGKNKKFTF